MNGFTVPEGEVSVRGDDRADKDTEGRCALVKKNRFGRAG